MGVSCPNETKCLYKILPNRVTLRKNVYAVFNQNFLNKEHFVIAIVEQ